jgi:hypothetical protein
MGGSIMKYEILEKTNGAELFMNGKTYYELERWDQGWCYKDEKAFEDGFGLVYIPEYAVENFEGEQITIEGRTFYNGDDIEDVYTYSDLLNLCHGNHGHALFMIQTLDWQYPESLYDELNWEDTI